MSCKGRPHEKRFRALVQQSPDAFLILDANGRIAYHSPALPELTGRTDTDCRGRRLLDLFSPDAEPTVAAMLSYVGQTVGRSHRTAISVWRGENHTREIELVATNRPDEPAIGGIVLTIRDITERIQFERQLARQDKMDAVGRMWLDGRPYWNGVQMDETALPILLVDLAARYGVIDTACNNRSRCSPIVKCPSSVA